MIQYLQAMVSSRRSDTLSLLGMVSLLGFASYVMMAETSWSEGSPGLTRLPEPGDGNAGLSLMLLYTVQASMATCALLMRRIHLPIIFGISLALAPTVLLYDYLVTTVGFGAPAVQIDEFARVILAGGAAILLLLPWVLRRLRWPARTPGHLAIGVAVLSGAVLQVVFHFALVIPGSEISFSHYDRTISIIEETSTPGEIDRLVEISALPLQPVEASSAEAALIDAKAVSIPTILVSLEAILEEAPRTLHHWRIPGQSKIDRMALVYDGRGPEPALWLLPSSAFLEPRLTAISAYYYLTGLSSFVWLTGALLVHAGHARRGQRRQAPSR